MTKKKTPSLMAREIQQEAESYHWKNRMLFKRHGGQPQKKRSLEQIKEWNTRKQIDFIQDAIELGDELGEVWED